MIAVNLNQLSKKYGRRIGISGIDLTVNEGEIFGLIGPDGAGKTTILRILMNYILPSDGEAEVFDMDVVDEAKEIKKETAYVPGEIYFYNKMKAGKYINLILKANHHKKDERFKNLMQAFEIDPREKFEDMDRSDQKKMALMAALAVEPRLLLLDEPLRGLDANIQGRLFGYLKELQENGTTIIITGRDGNEIAPICERMAIIENGEITVDADTFANENPDFLGGDFIVPSTETEEIFDDTLDISAMEDSEKEYESEDDELEKTIVIMPDQAISHPIQSTPTTEAVEDSEKTADAPVSDNSTSDAPIEAPLREAHAPAKKKQEKKTSKQKNEKHNPEKYASVTTKKTKHHKNITMKSTGFKRDAFENIGAKIVSEEGGKIIMEYSGDLNVLAKLLYDLDMDDICVSSKDLQEVFLPFYEGGENA